MSDLSKIVLPSGDEYDLKDASSRDLLGSETLTTTSQTVTGAINELDAKTADVEIDETTIVKNTNDELSVNEFTGTKSEATEALSSLEDGATIYTTDENSGDTITIDDTPTSGSTNAVSSGGVYTAINNINEVIPSTASSSNKLTTADDIDWNYTSSFTDSLDFDFTSVNEAVVICVYSSVGASIQIPVGILSSTQITFVSGGYADSASQNMFYATVTDSSVSLVTYVNGTQTSSTTGYIMYR